jgi:hypothetical protein
VSTISAMTALSPPASALGAATAIGSQSAAAGTVGATPNLPLSPIQLTDVAASQLLGSSQQVDGVTGVLPQSIPEPNLLPVGILAAAYLLKRGRRHSVIH